MKAIFATTQNFLLGLGGTMPWCHSDEYEELSKMDMSYFREMTKSCKVVMGYNTWKSIGEKPLNGRKEHFIITNKKGLVHDDERVRFMDLKTFIKKYAKEDVICIGGGQIYKELMPYYTEIYWNELKLDDSFFNEVIGNFEDKVYLNRKLVHLLKYPEEFNFRETTTVMQLDSKGNTITYKRYIRKATP